MTLQQLKKYIEEAIREWKNTQEYKNLIIKGGAMKFIYEEFNIIQIIKIIILLVGGILFYLKLDEIANLL